MGLDISAIAGPLIDKGHKDNFDERQMDDLIDSALTITAYTHPSFEDRLKPLQRGHIYVGNHKREHENFGFRAGSYSGYGQYRDWLIGLGQKARRGMPTDVDKPFYEQVNFSDCEGVIGPVASGDLYNDYASLHEKAKEHPEDWFLQVYENFMAAFKLAAETEGAVVFH